MTRVDLNQGELAALRSGLATTEALLLVGEQVAERAKQAAPKRSGAGAASIHVEAAEGFGGVATVRVGWSEEHFYMAFHELGTSKLAARPFLRPALDAQYDI